MSLFKTSTIAIIIILFGANLAIANVQRSVGNYPKSINGPGFKDAFNQASKSGQFITHHVQLHWAKLQKKSFEKYYSEYNWMRYLLEHDNKGLGLLLLLDVTPVSDRRQIIDLPKKYKKANFANANLRQAYLEEVLWLADHFKPQYFALAVEIEGYYVGHPDDFDNFVSLYKEAYQLLKKRHPEMRVFVYFQYEGLQGLWQKILGARNSTKVPINNLWFLLDKFMPELDAVAFSSYPEANFQRPEQIPDTYYDPIKKYTGRPVVFSEIGWSSKYNPSGTITNTEQTQANFVRKFAKITRGLNVELVNWYFLHDMEGKHAFRNMPKWFSTMGLRSANGNPKPAWGAWNDPDLWVETNRNAPQHNAPI